jgi:hypothetical protein
LAALAREGPREGVDTAPRKPERETRQERQRSAASAARGRTRPARSRKAPNGVDAARRSEGTGHVMAPLPRPRGGSQNPSFPLGAQVPRMHREPASTGTRSREFGKQTSVGRIVGCLGGEALQGAASRKTRCLAGRKPSPRWEKVLTTGDGGERAKTVRRSPALLSQVSRRGLIRGLKTPAKANDTVSVASGVTPVVL